MNEWRIAFLVDGGISKFSGIQSRSLKMEGSCLSFKTKPTGSATLQNDEKGAPTPSHNKSPFI
jgi:hypothetical protein